MKILFINLKDIEGGAALAAYRLSKGLETYYHTENYFVVKEKRSGNDNIFAAIDKQSESLEKMMIFTEFMVDRLFNKFGFQYYYLPFSPGFILKKARELKPDIISLHIIHGGYFKTSHIKKLSKIAPIVWTLHDMWSFAGSAAHTFGDESWKQLKSSKEEKKIYPHIGVNRGKQLLKRKRRIYKKSNLHIVVPSHWLYNLVKQSPVFENKPIYRITHGVDLESFKPMDKDSCREALGIPKNAKVLMFSSSDDLARSPWKGGQLLLDILTAINSRVDDRIETLVLGKGRLSGLEHLNQLNIRQMGYINNEGLISLLLSAADLFIYPTRADSLGLVLVESIACGTPCITFDIGGCRDVIENDISGYKIEPFDTEAFAVKTVELLNDLEKRDKLSAAARKFAQDHFDLKDMAAAYYRLFRQILPGPPS
jgi:glycosyltransferase involved in cell wall biosynthesis